MSKYTCVVLIAFLIFVIHVPAFTKDIRVVCPYLGPIANVYENEKQNIELDDVSLLKGLFFQWVNPSRYQWNTFIYQASDINYSTLWGGHFIFDLYLGVKESGKFVVGSGIEFISIDMDAGAEIVPLEDFELVNNIIIPYLRGGYLFKLTAEKVNITILPWAGAQYEGIRGEITIDPPGPFPPIPVKEDIEEDDLYGMVGLNVRVNLFHMLDVESKYRATFDTNDYLSIVSAMVNLFFIRHVGISYRFKYMQTTVGSDLYNIFGIAFTF